MAPNETIFLNGMRKLFAGPAKYRFLLEAISKPRLRPDSCVASLFKMLTFSIMLRFFIGLRLALKT